jgi:hypothetical protein
VQVVGEDGEEERGGGCGGRGGAAGRRAGGGSFGRADGGLGGRHHGGGGGGGDERGAEDLLHLHLVFSREERRWQDSIIRWWGWEIARSMRLGGRSRVL